MELSHLLTRSGLTYPEVSSMVCHDSFCQSDSSISLPWVIYFEAFYLHVVSSFSCIPVICPKLVLILIHLQFVHLFCNLSKCVLLFFSLISSPITHSGEILATDKSHGKKPDWVSLNDDMDVGKKNIQVPNVMKICQMGAELFYVDGQTFWSHRRIRWFCEIA